METLDRIANFRLSVDFTHLTQLEILCLAAVVIGVVVTLSAAASYKTRFADYGVLLWFAGILLTSGGVYEFALSREGVGRVAQAMEIAWVSLVGISAVIFIITVISRAPTLDDEY